MILLINKYFYYKYLVNGQKWLKNHDWVACTCEARRRFSETAKRDIFQSSFFVDEGKIPQIAINIYSSIYKAPIYC